ncbi:MAG: DUF6442 family protein [Clostridiales bacterium]|nr:DUF6442 family protein [Clostridiales bacterium]
MEKNEILKKAQAQRGADELEAHVKDRSSAVAISVGFIVCIAVVICKQVAHLPSDDVFMVYWTMFSAVNFYQWYRLRKRKDLGFGISGAALAAIHGVRLFGSLFG